MAGHPADQRELVHAPGGYLKGRIQKSEFKSQDKEKTWIPVRGNDKSNYSILLYGACACERSLPAGGKSSKQLIKLHA
jgi:hypothetical protein